jgi:tRNA G18 (ribose-2'-O)-methylase SpoU
MIDDASDVRLDPYRLVGDPHALDRDGLFVAEGRLVVVRLLEDRRFAIHSVLVTPAAESALRGALAARPDVPVHVCEPEVLRAITGFSFHRGCLALAYRGAEPHPSAPGSWPPVLHARRVLALEGVTDPDNVGGLFRTAFAFGVDAVILDRATADPLYRKAIRTSMAATLRLPFVRVDAWVEGLQLLRDAGLRVIALTPHPDAVPLDAVAIGADDRLVIVAGSEGSGMSPESLALADARVRIPVDPLADSLNVVTAAAIALHALRPSC